MSLTANQIIRNLLKSADASWLEGGGHDWKQAVEEAEAHLRESELAAPTGSAFSRVIDNDATVNAMLRHGSSLEAIIVILAAEKDRAFKRIIELESIAPRKITLPDGHGVAVPG